MKPFITGATGFIGSNLSKWLVDNGYEVTCLVRPQADCSYLQKLGVRLVTGDLLSPESFMEHVTDCDTVFHIAGVTKALKGKDYYTGNTLATENLVHLLNQAGTSTAKIIYLSSQAAAGPSTSPDFSENLKPCPVSHYGRSKLEAEKIIINKVRNKNFTILRPSIVFGPHDQEMLALFRAAQFGIIPHPGVPPFPVSFIYINDLFKAIILAATVPQAAGKTYFVNDGNASSWQEMSRLIKQEMKSKAIILPVALRILQIVCLVSGLKGKLMKKAAYMNMDKWQEIKQAGWLCSNSGIESELGFTPDWTLEEAVSSTISWYRKHNYL